jgi:hypothetical protein
MSLDLARNDSYAHLDDSWLRHQSARICQRHLQFGRHCRLDLDALLVAAARLLPRWQHATSSCRASAFHQATFGAGDFFQASKDSQQWRLATARELLDATEA